MLRLIGVLALLFGFFGKNEGKYRRLKKQELTDPAGAQSEAVGMVRAIFRKMLKVAGTDITVIGRENVPEGQPVLYVGNHRSFFDILVGYTSTKGRLGFVAKVELARFRLLAKWMRMINCTFIDRDDLKQSLKAILASIKNVKSGASMWIFPEGTRNRGEILDLAPFKDGSFKIAEKAGCPVVPVAITGTAEILEQHFPWIRPSKVTITFGKPVYIRDLPKEIQKQPGEYFRQQVIGMLREQEKKA